MSADMDKKVKKIRSRSWIFVWNNYDEKNVDTLVSYFKLRGILYVFQEETGANGTPHLQGVIKFKNAVCMSFQKELSNVIHWERCRSWPKSTKYCSKLESRTGKIYYNVHGLIPEKAVYDKLTDVEPYDWQKKIIDLIQTKPDDRSIYWYYDVNGGIGKTILCKHLVLKYDAIVVGGRMQDALFMIAKRKELGKPITVVIFDVNRSGNISYNAIESIKNGLCFAPKYESSMLVFDCPHVIVMSNSEPDYDKLSKDRWIVEDISDYDRSDEY